MKIFKHSTLDSADLSNVKQGETVICRPKDNAIQYQIYYARLKGVYTPMGIFSDLKTAIASAKRIESPTMIENGYQIIDLGGNQHMIMYYEQANVDVLEFIHNTGQVSDIDHAIGDSGICVRFLVQKNEIEEINDFVSRDEMTWFGQYLLSDARRKLFASHPELGSDNLEDRLKQVHHSDFDNYQIWRSTDRQYYDLQLDENHLAIPVRNEFRADCPDRDYEMRVLSETKAMCEQSLSPEGFESFNRIIEELIKNRKGLKGN